MTKVAYLGPEGTYTHQAALQQFEGAELLPQKTIKDCFTVLSDADYSVVPFENSTNGQVAMTYDLLRDWLVKNQDSGIHVVYEQFVAIHHCVLSNAKDISRVSKIYTHPQAWGQCSEWLSRYPHLETIDSSSTSKAAEIASQSDDIAAISSSYAAEVHDIPILEHNIENNKDNTTRFLVLSKTHTNKLPEKFITLLAFTVEHEDPGALANTLQILTDRKINLTSITSRPSIQEPWHYVFFIEFWIDGSQWRAVYAELKEACLSSVVLGQFPRSKRFYGEC